MATAHRRNHHAYDLEGDIKKIKSALFDVTNDIKGKAGEVIFSSLESAKEKTVAAKDNVAEYVTEKPLKSLGIALTAGLLVGYFLRLRK